MASWSMRLSGMAAVRGSSSRDENASGRSVGEGSESRPEGRRRFKHRPSCRDTHQPSRRDVDGRRRTPHDCVRVAERPFLRDRQRGPGALQRPGPCPSRSSDDAGKSPGRPGESGTILVRGVVRRGGRAGDSAGARCAAAGEDRRSVAGCARMGHGRARRRRNAPGREPERARSCVRRNPHAVLIGAAATRLARPRRLVRGRRSGRPAGDPGARACPRPGP